MPATLYIVQERYLEDDPLPWQDDPDQPLNAKLRLERAKEWLALHGHYRQSRNYEHRIIERTELVVHLTKQQQKD